MHTLLHGYVAILSLWLALNACQGYQGFDCGQGNAIMRLASHTQCGDSSQVACFKSMAMLVRKCLVKAWVVRHPHKNHMPCWGIQLVANVTNINRAQGLLSGPVAGGGRRRAPVPVFLEFSRPDESMYVQYGACMMRFDVQAASDASLKPAPGEEGDAVSSLLALLLPAILVPCVCVGLIMAVGSLSTGRMRAAGGDDSHGLNSAAGAYSQLPAGPSEGIAIAPSCAGTSGSVQASACLGTMGLFSRTFNLKAMSRRAQARRLRRSTRPVYIGLPHESTEQQQMYAAGRLQPGPLLVAPCFRFPPVAVAPGLPAIPEASTPSSGSSAPSRSSSCHDMDVPAQPGEKGALAAAAAAALVATENTTHASCQLLAGCEAATANPGSNSSWAKQMQQHGQLGRECCPEGEEPAAAAPLGLHVAKWLLGRYPQAAGNQQSV